MLPISGLCVGMIFTLYIKSCDSMAMKGNLDFFGTIFDNAKQNCMIIMNEDGIILDVNAAFAAHFGYRIGDVHSRYYNFLFTAEDQKLGKAESELEICKTQGTANDENYVMHRNGNKIWVTGETLKVTNNAGHIFLVKIIHIIHTQKLLEGYLLESNEFIEAIFDTLAGTGLIIINSRMKIIRYNKAFTDLFHLHSADLDGKRLTDLDIILGKDPGIKEKLRNVFITGMQKEIRNVTLHNKEGDTVLINVRPKLIEADADRKLLLVLTSGHTAD